MCNQILIYILGIVKKITDIDEINMVDFFFSPENSFCKPKDMY